MITAENSTRVGAFNNLDYLRGVNLSKFEFTSDNFVNFLSS